MPKLLIQEYWIIEFWHNSSLDSLRNFSMNWSSYLWVWGVRHRKFPGGLFFVCLFYSFGSSLQKLYCSSTNVLLQLMAGWCNHFTPNTISLALFLASITTWSLLGFCFALFFFLCHDLNKQNEDIFLVLLMKHFLLPLVSHLKPLPAPIPHLPILLTCF